MTPYEYVSNMIDHFDKCEESINYWLNLKRFLIYKGISPIYMDLELRQDDEGNIYTLVNAVDPNSKHGLRVVPTIYKCRDEYLEKVKSSLRSIRGLHKCRDEY